MATSCARVWAPSFDSALRTCVRTVLRQLMHLGVGVQLDDFGTGYSSLTVLHDFPGDTLKIDRTFVDTMTDRAESQAIIRSIIGLAHNLGLRVVAEGIERPEQLRELIELGCQYGQGYHFARPLPTDEIEQLLARGEMPGVDELYALPAAGARLSGG